MANNNFNFYIYYFFRCNNQSNDLVFLQKFPVHKGVNRLWQKWPLLEIQQEPVDWLIMGDSSCGQGLRPDIFEKNFGGNAINLCSIANATVINDAWQLQRYIEKVGPPKNLVLFYVFHIWERDEQQLIAMFDQIPLNWGFWNNLEPSITLTWYEQLELATRPVTALYSYNLSVQYLINESIKNLFKNKNKNTILAKGLRLNKIT